jgi:hypothetical protein
LTVSFVIDAWAACAPGLESPAAWLRWADGPWLPVGEPQAALAAVPPMLRRRFGPLGRVAAQAGFELAASQAGAVPTVYASRYGDAARCLALLADHARGDALSPAAFGLSVHNAIGALVAITREDRSNSAAIAAGRATAAAGLVEAIGLLEDEAPAAALVVYDAPLIPDYAGFEDEPSAPFAWAWRVRRPRAGEPALHLDWPASGTPAPAADARVDALPASLQVLWFALSGAPALHQEAEGRRLRWSRDV